MQMIRFSVLLLGAAAVLSASVCVAGPWIDLGDEGATQYLSARMTTPEPVPDLSYLDPVDNPGSALMLDLPGRGKDPTKIDFSKLPQLPARHAMISDVRDRGGNWVHQHAYLVGGRHIDYPHLIEHDDTLLISFSGAKQTVEVLSIPLRATDAILESRSDGGS